MVHLINLQNFRILLQEIDGIAENLGPDNDFHNILTTKNANLKKSFLNLIPKSRKKRSWESLGSAIKWISGLADADDLRDIDHKLSDLTSSNDEQAEINTVFEDRLNALSRVISTSISSRLNATFTALEIINLMFNIDLAREKLEGINEAIILAKVRVVSKNILGENEVNFIFEKLKSQNFPLSSTTEMYNYLDAAVEYKDDIIHYHVNIPQVENDFIKLHIEPLPIDGKQIIIDHHELLVKGNKTFAIIAQCLETIATTLCKPSHLQDISDDPCIPFLIRDESGDCIFKEINGKTEIKSISDGTLLIKNAAVPIKISNSCGMANHTIIGTFLILFRNCSVTLNGDTYENLELQHKEQFEILPFFNVTIRQRNIEPLVDMHELHDLHIRNRKKLEVMQEKREKDMMISISTLAIIVITIFIAFVIFMLKMRAKATTLILKPLETMTSAQSSRDETKLTPEESSATIIHHSLRSPFTNP